MNTQPIIDAWNRIPVLVRKLLRNFFLLWSGFT